MDRNAAVLAGISPGGSLSEATTGVCRTGSSGFVLRSTHADALSRAEALQHRGNYAVVAVGAPILPPGPLHYDPRPCERVFRWAPFQSRCGIHESASGSGTPLRRAGCDTARQFAPLARHVRHASTFPRVHPRADLVEAFPRGFLGVMLPDGLLAEIPAGGGRLLALHDACVRTGAWARVQAILGWHDDELWHALSSREHGAEEVAALTCAATSVGAWLGRYVAVGEPGGGFIFLPTWDLWDAWARRGLHEVRGSRRLPRPIDVWIDGRRFRPNDSLPP